MRWPAAHLDLQTEQFLDQRGIAADHICRLIFKIFALATSQADIYPRFGPTMEWDTAAGEAVLAGAAEQFMTRKDSCIVTASQAGGTARLFLRRLWFLIP